MKKYIIEFIGTFFLVFIIGLVTNDPGATPFAPIAIGIGLMTMVYMGGHISGAHYNPAVTLAILLNKKITAKDAIVYMIVQVVAAIVAALVFYFIFSKTMGQPKPMAGLESDLKPMLMELIFTFALALVVLNVAATEETAGNSYYGFAIGSTVMVAAFAVGGYSGGAFNPAVGTGPAVVNAMLWEADFSHWWIYLVGPFAGAALAAVVYRMTVNKAVG